MGEQATSIPDLAQGQLVYLQLPAADVATSARFYERVFGWRVSPPETEFKAPRLIGQWVTDRSAAPEAGPVLWIHVSDLSGALDEAESAGATVVDPPAAHGPRLRASVADPAGNLIGLFQHGQHTPVGRTTENRTMPSSTVIPELVYDDVIEAIDWLCDRFGFEERWRAGDHRAQLSFGNGTIAITEPRTSRALPGPNSLVVRVSDVDTHLARARSRGAKIVAEPQDFRYGERQYTAEDLGGHRWCFSQSIADRAPEEWGGTTGPALDEARA